MNRRGRESPLWTLITFEPQFDFQNQNDSSCASQSQSRWYNSNSNLTAQNGRGIESAHNKTTLYTPYIYRERERGGLVWSKHRLSYTEHLKSKVGGQKDNHCLTKCGSIYHILCLEKVRQNHWRLVCTYRACTSIPWVQPLSSRSSPKAFPKRLQGHSVTVLKRSW